jgi:Winged helix DNA-binding domain
VDRSDGDVGGQWHHGPVTANDAAVMADRFAAQLLTGEPAGSAAQVVRRLLAVQGQDPRGVRLAIRVRSAGLTAADVDYALTTDRSLLITWLNRGTLHLIAAEDFWWLHPLTAPRSLAGCSRRLAQEGVPPADAERAVGVIEAALAANGPLTRRQLGERIAAAGVRTQGQALVHILFLASIRGIVVRGPMIAGEHAFALVRDWLGAPPARFDRDLALAELARRYLAGHGPAGDRDLAKWAGLPLGEARRALTAIAGELRERADGQADLAGPAEPGLAGSASPAVPPPRLLGAFDPLLHGWASREPVLGPHQGIVTVNGIFRPFALVDGRAAAIWSLPGGVVKLAPLSDLRPADEEALDADAADVRRFLGLASAN